MVITFIVNYFLTQQKALTDKAIIEDLNSLIKEALYFDLETVEAVPVLIIKQVHYFIHNRIVALWYKSSVQYKNEPGFLIFPF